MARQITTQACNAFMSAKPFNKDNMSVVVEPVSFPLVHMYLHGNLIAKRFIEEGKTVLMVSNAGWATSTTKERLNGIPGVSVVQRKGVWYLNGKEWDGRWTTV